MGDGIGSNLLVSWLNIHGGITRESAGWIGVLTSVTLAAAIGLLLAAAFGERRSSGKNLGPDDREL
jgi:hypothetical protein